MKLSEDEMMAVCAEAARTSRLAQGLPSKIESEAIYRRVGYLLQRGEAMLEAGFTNEART